jgi:hypothetical protein
LAGQGLGYPSGQLATRAASGGGGLAELDAASPLNPAALSTWGTGGLYLQSDPEYRTVRLADASDRTRIIHFPILSTAARIGTRITVGLSASSLLDQLWSTTMRRTQSVGGDSIISTTVVRNEGSVSDVRFAVAWAPRAAVRLGVAAHVLSGRTRSATGISFESIGFSNVVHLTESIYGGNAFSAGIVVSPSRALALGASGRIGGALRIDSAGVKRTGDVPARAGASLAYTGLRGVSAAANVEWNGWATTSRITSGARNTLDYGIGLEFTGPLVVRRPLALRAGARWRELPFPALGTNSDESAVSAGIGYSLAGGGTQSRARLDVGLTRATRQGGSGVSEQSWILSTGFSIRP